MVRIHFVLVAEGASDEGLIGHLEGLCIEAGASEVTGIAPDFGRLREHVGHTILEKLTAAALLEPAANLFFVHRDSDSRNPMPRYREIADAVASVASIESWVAVIPVQETEAWLLLDERAIRTVAGRPTGTTHLNLPSPAHIENVARPKERLKATLIAAAELTGRRLSKFRAQYPIHRRLLLQRLPTSGAIEQLQSWIQLRDDVYATVNAMSD